MWSHHRALLNMDRAVADSHEHLLTPAAAAAAVAAAPGVRAGVHRTVLAHRVHMKAKGRRREDKCRPSVRHNDQTL